MSKFVPSVSNFCLLVVIVQFSSIAMGQEPNQNPAASQSAERFVRQALKVNDKNNDGKVTSSEARGPLRQNFRNVDADKNGEVTTSELTAFATRMMTRRATANRQKPVQAAVPADVVLETDIAYRQGQREDAAGVSERRQISVGGQVRRVSRLVQRQNWSRVYKAIH